MCLDEVSWPDLKTPTLPKMQASFFGLEATQPSPISSLFSMKGTKVKVKWDKKWYPATVLRQIGKDRVEVDFEDPEYPSAIVLLSDIKAPNVSLTSPSVIPAAVAGAFNWPLFKKFCEDTIGDSDFITPLSDEELAGLDLKTAPFSRHASERKDERYQENMQELLRSLNTDQICAFRETRQRVLCDGLRFDCTPDFMRVLSVKPDERSLRLKDCADLQPMAVGLLKNAVVAWNRINPRSVYPLDFESYKLFGEAVTIQIVTTTTRFVLNDDCSSIITVIKLDVGFKEWQKLQRQNQKPPSKEQKLRKFEQEAADW